MSSKIEILQKHTNKKYDISPNATTSYTDDLLAAMDEYAKQQSVAFNKWFIMYKTEKLNNCAGNKDEYKKWALMSIEDYYDIFNNDI